MAYSLTLLCLLVVAAAVAAKPSHHLHHMSPEDQQKFEAFKVKMMAINGTCTKRIACQPEEVTTYMNSTRVACKNNQTIPAPTGCVPCFIECFMQESGKIAPDGTFVVPEHIKDEAERQEIQDCYDPIPKSGDSCMDAVKAGGCIHNHMKKKMAERRQQQQPSLDEEMISADE